MHILHWVESFETDGGQGIFTRHLAAAQAREGHTVSVLENSPHETCAPRESRDGIEIHRTPFKRAVLDNNLALLARTVRDVTALRGKIQPDVSHVHADGWLGWLHLLTSGTGATANVITLHAPRPLMTLPASILHRMLQSADRVVAVSAATRAGWCAQHDGLEAKSMVILNGIPAPDEPVVPPSGNPATLLCLGRLDPIKGFDVALRAFHLLAAHWPETRLILAGSGPARSDLEQLARELGLTERVIFRGWIPPSQVAAAIDAATLVLMPSRWQEPFGLVAVEAAQRGRPVIASRVGGLPEIVVDGETGLLVPPDDASALARAIDSQLRQPGSRQRMSTAARERAGRCFTMTRCAADYARLYRELTGTPAPS